MMHKSRILAVGVILLVVVIVTISRTARNTESEKWKLSDPNSTYIIHGVTNYDTGSTYYLYKEIDGKREVIMVDPTSPVNFKNVTDRKVNINGSVVKNKNGQTMIRITWVERSD